MRNIEHHQQLHQMIVGRLRQRLHDVDTPITYRGTKLDVEIIVAETGDVGIIQRDAQVAGDTGSKRRVGTSAKKADFLGWDRGLVILITSLGSCLNTLFLSYPDLPRIER